MTDATSEDAFFLGVDVIAAAKGKWTFSAGYALTKGHDFETHDITARARMKF